MGLLTPDQRINVTVDFVPVDGRQHNVRLPVKVSLHIHIFT